MILRQAEVSDLNTQQATQLLNGRKVFQTTRPFHKPESDHEVPRFLGVFASERKVNGKTYHLLRRLDVDNEGKLVIDNGLFPVLPFHLEELQLVASS